MSTFSVPVVSFTLDKHPEADTLSIATIKGWVSIVKTEDLPPEEKLGVYVPIDTVASPDHPFLSFLEGKKIKAIRLRGVFSQGVLLPLSKVKQYYDSEHRKLHGVPHPDFVWHEGFDVQHILGVKKWVPLSPPLRLTVKSSIAGAPKYSEVSRPAWLHKYTDIQNWNNWNKVIKENELVEVTLKLHGTSAIFAKINDEYYICSRNRCLRTKTIAIRIPRFDKSKKIAHKLGLKGIPFFSKRLVLPPPDSIWHNAFAQFNIKEKLDALEDHFDNENVAIYGEIIGCQDLMYGLKKGEIDFYAYDIRVSHSDIFDTIISDYLPPSLFDEVCHVLKIKRVPVLYEGRFTPEVLELRNGKDPIGKTHTREGIVIKPLMPRTDPKLGRVILKKIGEDYLLRKNDKDESEYSLEQVEG